MVTTTPLGPTGAAIANNFTRAITDSLQYDAEDAHAAIVLVLGIEVLVDFARVLFADPAEMIAAMAEALTKRPGVPLNPAMQELADTIRAAERDQVTQKETTR